MKNVISFSGGKDSTATVILAHEHNIPAKVVMACLWFDKDRGIPAINVEHWNFITNVIVPRFREWGFEVEFVEGKHSYRQLFYRPVSRSKYPERIGKCTGFVFAGGCYMTREKINAIQSIQRKYKDCMSIQGIAIDEPDRLETLHKQDNSISLLEQYGYTEQMALELCEKYGLLSPIYKTRARDGCWFCPNQRISEWSTFRKQHPELWHELEIMSKCDNLVGNKFVRNKTFKDLSLEIDRYEREQETLKNQITIEDILKEVEQNGKQS